VFGTNSTGTGYGNNLTFTTGNSPGSPPTCNTDPASNVITNSARLNGTVNPNGVVTDAYFEYGISTNPYPISTTLQPIGNGITSVALSATVSSLTPNTLYNFRVVGTNGPLTTTYGNNLTFTTLVTPTCTTNDATNVASASATLNGTVNPNGVNVTSCYFDYGTSVSYGSQQSVASLPGSGTSPISVTANVSPLSATTLYNFRVVATNAGGTTNGNNQTFTTSALAVDDYCWVVNWAAANTTRIKKSDSTTTTIAGEGGPQGVAVDETYCWVANRNSPNVTRIKKSNLSTTTITVGAGHYGVAVDETYCWVVDSNNNVTRILKSDTTISTTITVGTGPWGVAVDGTYCWVINNGSADVTRILKSDLSTTTIAVGTNPRGVAVDETYCWVANWGSSPATVTRIQKSDLSTTTITVGTQPVGVAVDETYCWVANWNSNTVTRIQKSDLSTTMITVGTNPRGVSVDGTYCWVVNYAGGTATRILKADSTTTNITITVGYTQSYSLGDMTGYAYDNYSQGP
jgi:hypothetical protein